MNTRIAAALTLLLCACTNDDPSAGAHIPARQQSYSDRMAALCRSFVEASSDENTLRRTARTTPIVADIKRVRASEVEAHAWVASIVSIVDNAQDWTIIKAQWKSITLLLMLHRPSGDPFIRSLSVGDTIVFSGPMGSEASVTNDGGACRPEFWFAPESVSTEKATLSQAAEVIAAARAARAAEIDSARLELEDAHHEHARTQQDAL